MNAITIEVPAQIVVKELTGLRAGAAAQANNNNSCRRGCSRGCNRGCRRGCNRGCRRGCNRNCRRS